MEYILASKSPRRKELFSLLVPQFACETAEVDERAVTITDPEVLCLELAKLKCRAVAKAHPDCCVIGSDTMVAVDGKLLGKPADREDELRMLRMLSGSTHEVHTGICLHLPDGREMCGVDTATVHMMPLTEENIRRYIATGEPMDKAGAYAIQGRAGIFISHIEGSPSSVIGLPLGLLTRFFDEAGIDYFET